MRDLGSVTNALDRNVNYDIKKLIEDDKLHALLIKHNMEGLYPLISYLNSLTYLTDDNMVYARRCQATALLLIEECFTSESDTERIQLVNSMRYFIDTQIFDARKGFKATTVTENRTRIDVPGLAPQPRKKFMGIF